MATLRTSDNSKIYYQFVNEKSKKTPIVFVHGFAVNWTCFKREIKFFEKEGHPVLYFDLRGHGKSSKSKEAKDYSFERFSKDILELLKQNKIKKKIVLIGHSLGGMISLKFTSTHQSKIEKLILIDSADKAPNQNFLVEKIQKSKSFRTTYTFLAQTYQKQINREKDVTKEEIHESPELFITKAIICNDPKSMLKITDTIFSRKNLKAKQIICPTLIIGSSDDELFSKKEEMELSKKIKNNIIKFFPGHHDIIMRQPEVISREIKQFIHTNKDFFSK